MSELENPYRSPQAEIALPDTPGVPLMMKLVVGLYATVFLLRFGRWVMLSGGLSKYGALIWLGVALLTLLISMSLLRGRRWARAWLMFFTALPVISLVELGHFPVLTTDLMRVGADLLRIAAAMLLFLPSIRRWVATRTSSVATTSA